MTDWSRESGALPTAARARQRPKADATIGHTALPICWYLHRHSTLHLRLFVDACSHADSTPQHILSIQKKRRRQAHCIAHLLVPAQAFPLSVIWKAVQMQMHPLECNANYLQQVLLLDTQHCPVAGKEEHETLDQCIGSDASCSWAGLTKESRSVTTRT